MFCKLLKDSSVIKVIQLPGRGGGLFVKPRPPGFHICLLKNEQTLNQIISVIVISLRKTKEGIHSIALIKITGVRGQLVGIQGAENKTIMSRLVPLSPLSPVLHVLSSKDK